MRGARRSVLGCAAAGLFAATGCIPTTASLADPAPLARLQPSPVPPVPGIPAPPPDLQAGRGPLPTATPPLAESDTPLPINLATALHLSGGRPLDVQIAGRQVAVAAALFDRARLLWVPN